MELFISPIDWLIVALFLGLLMAIGYAFSHKNKDVEDYFAAGRSMPGWIVAIAATGTTISAGTFVGSPELGFNTDLTYVMNLIGSIFGGILVAALIMPKLYKANTITIYGYIGDRFGETSKRVNSAMFLLGQLFTSGSRLFIAAIAISVIVFGEIKFDFMVYSIIILGVVSTIYTMLGGIKGLLYIDTFQTLLLIGTGVIALIWVFCELNGDMGISFADIWATITDGGLTKLPGAADAGKLLEDGTIGGWAEGDKLQMFDFSLSKWNSPYTVIAGMIGVAFFKICQYTTDHEFVQRQLACRDVKQASKSLVWSQLLALPVVLVFLMIGVLLFAKYKLEFLNGGEVSKFFADARDVFPQYIKNNIPTGLRGLMIVGLLAAALSSFNSAINAMASSFVTDLYLPIRAARGAAVKSDADQLSSSRKMVLLMGAMLTGFAIVTAVMQEASGLNLVDFATGVMCFAYAGMIGVFLTAIFSKRGNTASVIAAIIVGMLIIIPLMFQKQIFGSQYIAWTWWAPIGGVVSTIVCMLGKPEKR